LENLPKSGPCIVAANHLSILDAPLVYGLIGSEEITGWAAEKWEWHPIFGPILRLGGGIFIDRGEVDREALRAAVRWLQDGKVFGMSPEGTRSRVGALIRAKTGVAYLAHETKATIVPLAVIGTDTGIEELLHFKRPELTVRIGKPFHLPPLDPDQRTASLRRNADEVMCRIAALLPPRYWGVYAEHPRLKEILAASAHE
jgi:1-acyl-sn-glycerol-3-phosphate acyltransferase